MKKILIIALVLISNLTFAQLSKNFIDQPYIEVTGKARMEVVPDEIYLHILVREVDSKPKLSLAELEKAIVNKLNEIGIDTEKDFSVKDFSSNFKDYLIKRTGIVAKKEYQLLIHDTKTLVRVYTELEKLGVSNITIIKTDHSEIEKLTQQVKVNAVKAGRAKAELLAETAGQNLGEALHIRENAYGPIRQNANTTANIRIRGAASISESEAPEINFEKIILESSIELKFALIPKLIHNTK